MHRTLPARRDAKSTAASLWLRPPPEAVVLTAEFTPRVYTVCLCTIRCGNVAAILELDEHLQREFIIFEAAPQETRGIPSKKPVADYFL